MKITMIHLNKTIFISTFIYPHATDNKPFSEEYIRADLKRLLSFLTASDSNNFRLTICTDIHPKKSALRELKKDYLQMVATVLKPYGFSWNSKEQLAEEKNVFSHPYRLVYHWIKQISSQNSLSLEELKEKIKTAYQPKIDINNVVEYMFYFHRYYYINNKRNYFDICQEFFSSLKSEDFLFVYLSGHGAYDEKKVFRYIIPTGKSHCDYLRASKLSTLIEDRCPAKNIFIILDMCYSGKFFGLPYTLNDEGKLILNAYSFSSSRPNHLASNLGKVKLNSDSNSNESFHYRQKNLLLFASSGSREPSGFCREEPNCGSLFLTVLLQGIKNKSFSDLKGCLNHCREKVISYRKKNNEAKQTPLIQASHHRIEEFEKFVFRTS